MIVLTIALHVLEVGLRGGSNAPFTELVLAGLLALVVTVVLVRYWLRRRALDPIAQTFSEVESCRPWRHLDAGKVIRVSGFLLLLAMVLAAVLTNRTKVAGSVVLVAILLLRGWDIWRFIRRLFQRKRL